MKSGSKILGAVAVAAVAALAFTGCSASEGMAETPTRKSQLQDSQASFDQRRAPEVTGDAEYNNYIKAQEEIYDDPSNILWCTAAFPNATSPIFTVPIAGKLTSSSVSFFPNTITRKYSAYESYGWVQEEAQSVDGMYHGNPGPYRYGFTPGGQYVDFTGLAVFCSTALTEFQRVSLTAGGSENDGVTERAEQALRDGDPAKADEILKEVTE